MRAATVVALACIIAACSSAPVSETKTMSNPYGTWKSALSASEVAAEAVRLEQVEQDGDDVYWIEGRPSEQGRQVVVRRGPSGQLEDLTPKGFNARSRVHQYGGGSYAVHKEEVFFSNFSDNRVYRVRAAGAAPKALTVSEKMYYADCIVDAKRKRLICVREDHTASDQKAVNTLVSLSLDKKSNGTVLMSGSDFYSSPRLSPDGRHLAWLSWNHPNMPWDGTALWVAKLGRNGKPLAGRRVAGGVKESVFQPEWSPDGVLHFISDHSGWWNLYRVHRGEVEALAPMDAEFGDAQWQFGMSTYAFAGPRRIVCSYTRDGHWHLATLDTKTGVFATLNTQYAPYHSIRANSARAIYIGNAAASADAVVRVKLADATTQTLRAAYASPLDASWISAAQPIEFPTTGSRTAHAFYYAPKNPDVAVPRDERPPLIVISHGGPTAAAIDSLNLKIQYWTTRGFAVVDVNYGGSTGYGRAYRERLNGQWGIVDVDDCIAAARFLADENKADPKRLIIRGGSAGGYTTLAALAFHDVFRAGASYYGVSDAEALATDTHKFESHYLDRLIGPYPAKADLYRERSPIHSVAHMNAPLILFQGLEDQIVPPAQSEKMAQALRARNVPVAYIAFPGEQHGFRQAANISRSMEAEMYFYGAIFGFKPADQIEPVNIDNLAKN